jgi:hypothetical protein
MFADDGAVFENFLAGDGAGSCHFS